MEILPTAASSGSTSYRRNLDQAAVIAAALEQIFTSSAPAQERQRAAADYIADELIAAERRAAWETGESSFPPQLNLLEPSPLGGIVGLAVQPQTTCRRCGDPVAVVGAGKAMHHASLHCRSCDLHRGWLSRAHCAYLAEIVAEAGVPREPIILSDNNGIDRDPVQPRPLVSLHQQI
jgi:hypothetical protein